MQMACFWWGEVWIRIIIFGGELSVLSSKVEPGFEVRFSFCRRMFEMCAGFGELYCSDERKLWCKFV